MLALIAVFFLAAEFQKIAFATFIGFCVMGGIGFLIKLVHIPINNIIVYVAWFSGHPEDVGTLIWLIF